METNKVKTAVMCTLEAGGQGLIMNIFPDPQNEAFIRNRGIDFRFVDSAPVHQKDIPWLQVIGFSFNMIGDFS